MKKIGLILGVLFIILAVGCVGRITPSLPPAPPVRVPQHACLSHDLRDSYERPSGFKHERLWERVKGSVVESKVEYDACGNLVFAEITYRDCSEEETEWCERKPYFSQGVRCSVRAQCIKVLTLGGP